MTYEARSVGHRPPCTGPKVRLLGELPDRQTSREMLKVIVLFVALIATVGCSYVQMQPKGNDGPPAPAAPRLP